MQSYLLIGILCAGNQGSHGELDRTAKLGKFIESVSVTNIQPVSLSLALQQLRGAYDESRDELRDL